MNGMTFAIAFLIGSGVIAAWITVRFPKLCPSELPRLILHLAAGTLCLKLVQPVLTAHAPSMGSDAATTVGSLFLITFPLLTYFLLGMTWVVKMCTDMMGSSYR